MRRNRPDTTPLRLVPTLRDADRRRLEAVAPHTDVVRVPAGRAVTEAGRPAHEFLVLVDGEAEATGRDGSRRILRPGTELGAEAVRTHGRHDRTVVARTDATFVVITAPAFRSIDHPRAS